LEGRCPARVVALHVAQAGVQPLGALHDAQRLGEEESQGQPPERRSQPALRSVRAGVGAVPRSRRAEQAREVARVPGAVEAIGGHRPLGQREHRRQIHNGCAGRIPVSACLPGAVQHVLYGRAPGRLQVAGRQEAHHRERAETVGDV